jgi:hypothetical protein
LMFEKVLRWEPQLTGFFLPGRRGPGILRQPLVPAAFGWACLDVALLSID